MKIKWYTFSLLVLAIVAIFSLSDAKNDASTAQVPSATPEVRVNIANDWLKGLNEVYLRTEDKEVSDQLLDIEKHGVIAIPKQNGMIPSRKLAANDFVIVPLVEVDKNISPWGDLFTSPSVASYSGLDKILLLKGGNPITPLYEGIVFAHELKHRSFNPGGTSLDTPMNYCREEVIVHTFSNKLTLKIGGDAYQKLLDKRAEEWGVYFSDTKAKLSSAEDYLNDMEKIFGRSLSDAENEIRVPNFEIGAIYLAVDKYYTAGNKEEQKATLMCEMYKANGNALPGE